MKIGRLAARPLNTRLHFVIETKHLKESVIRHCLMEKSKIAEGPIADDDAAPLVNKVNADSKKYMTVSKKRYRHLSSGTIPFTPETAAMIRKQWVYQMLVGYKLGHNMNPGNLIRSARRHGIVQPLSIEMEEIWMQCP